MTAISVIFPPLLHYYCYKVSMTRLSVFLHFFVVVFNVVFMAISTFYSAQGLISKE